MAKNKSGGQKLQTIAISLFQSFNICGIGIYIGTTEIKNLEIGRKSCHLHYGHFW